MRRPGTIWTGDNLAVMQGMEDGSVDLIYLDPPFNTNRDYAAREGTKAEGARFTDTWRVADPELMASIEAEHPRIWHVLMVSRNANDKSYLGYMAVRLMEMKRLLKPTGSIYLHCNAKMNQYLRVLMDVVFGHGKFMNEITWKRSLGGNSLCMRRYCSESDTILFYAGPKATWNQPKRPLTEDVINTWYNKTDADGRRYTAHDLTCRKDGYRYEFLGETKTWRYKKEKMEELYEQGLILRKSTKPGVAGLKRYLDESDGAVIGDIWTDIPLIPRSSKERVGYPTQKPVALLERIIKASSNKGDVVFDPFCGSGTTLVAAEKLEREWVGIDVSEVATRIAGERMAEHQGLFGNVIYRRLAA